MAKKYVSYGDVFCTVCGERMEKKGDSCPKCGAPYGDEKYAGSDALGAGGTGWSVNAGHPSLKANKKKHLLGSFIFCITVSIIIFLVMYFEGGAGFEDENGFRIYGIVMAIIWAFWLIYLISTFRNRKDWIGVVESREKKDYQTTSRDDEGRSHTEYHTSYKVFFRLDNGRRKKLVNTDSSAWYDYLHEGDCVKCHGKLLGYYEKYDKSRDCDIPCASCGMRRDARENFCGKCGAVILKANTYRYGAEKKNLQPVKETLVQGGALKLCPGCGAETNGTKFCTNCGRQLRE